jgi:nucleoside-diphosphate-sugar epimerase
MLVHAPCEPGGRITEASPLRPTWPYPESKLRTEELIRTERGLIPAIIMRIAGVYDDWCHSIPLAHQIQRIYERRMTGRLYPGDTASGQAFVHLDDLVDAISRAVERRAELPPELPLLVGEPDTVSYGELQRVLGHLIHGKEWETRQIPKAVAKAGAWAQDHLPFTEEPFIKPWMVDRADDHYEIDITRTRELLGWEPRHSLRGTLPEMVANLKAAPSRWYSENKLKRPRRLEEADEPAGGANPGT